MRAVARAYRDAFSGLPRDTWMLAAVALINRAGAMVVPFLALYLTKVRGFDAELTGLLLGIWGVGSMVGTTVGGWLTDRIGPQRVELAALIATGLSFWILGLLRSPVSIAASLFLTNACADAFRPANLSHLALTCDPPLRTKALALNRLAINVGVAIGPTVGGFLALIGYRWLFVVDGATCIAAAAFFAVFIRPRRMRSLQAGPSAGPHEGAPVSILKDRVFAACLPLSLVIAAVFLQLFATAPLYLRSEYGFTEDRIGLLFAINPILVVLFEMVLVHHLQRSNPLRWIGLGSLFAGLGLAILPFGRGFPHAALGIVVLTLGEMLESPLLGGFLAGRASESNRGKAMGLYSLSWSLAFVLAPLVVMAVYEHAGPAQLFLGCGAVSLLVGLAYVGLARTVDREAQGGLSTRTEGPREDPGLP
jgi:predicted MFS family arabinose efflux permease